MILKTTFSILNMNFNFKISEKGMKLVSTIVTSEENSLDLLNSWYYYLHDLNFLTFNAPTKNIYKIKIKGFFLMVFRSNFLFNYNKNYFQEYIVIIKNWLLRLNNEKITFLSMDYKKKYFLLKNQRYKYNRWNKYEIFTANVNSINQQRNMS